MDNDVLGIRMMDFSWERSAVLRIFWIGWTLALGVNPGASAEESVDIEKFRASSEQWEDAVRELEARDRAEAHPEDSILFVGSSSVRMWPDISKDMAPYHPVQRGYGGASLADLVFFTERIVYPHAFRALVLFLGNDIIGGENDRTPDEVAGLFVRVLDLVRARHPDTPVFYVAVTPTRARWAAWPAIRNGNRKVQSVCEARPHTYFIATESVYLDAENEPREGLFLEDALHQNQAGYDRWAAVIKSHLDTVLGGANLGR
ncbi:MAG TPA: GDSL-type esterase/lipase family protein [Verrucomicrobiales bacterium]|nr:GDSL-type esterase/lipase family protein [Verrucomicrobiales bacterium]